MTNPTETQQGSEQYVSDPDEISLLDILIVLAKYKRMIAGITLGASLLAVVVTMLMPNIYTSAARVLPPQQSQSSAAMMLGQLSGLAGLAGGSLGLKNPSELYVGMLKSRTVADNIIARFDLQKLYERDTLVETRKELSRNTSIAAGRDGLITIEFDDEDPKRAAYIANAYVEELDKLTQTLAVTEAAQRRLFFERQLAQAKADLSKAEIALKTTQEQTGLIKLDDQGRAIIEAVAALRGQIAAKEVELRAMRTYTTETNPDYVRTEQQVVGLRAELLKLERAQAAGGSANIMLPTGKVPEAGLEYLRRFRDVKYQEAIFELLARQFEAAKIDEAKEAAVIQLVDQAIAPDRKSKPRRAVIVIVVALLAGLLAVGFAFVRDMQERVRLDPRQAARLAELRRYATLR